jgi:hypothetical protein
MPHTSYTQPHTNLHKNSSFCLSTLAFGFFVGALATAADVVVVDDDDDDDDVVLVVAAVVVDVVAVSTAIATDDLPASSVFDDLLLFSIAMPARSRSCFANSSITAVMVFKPSVRTASFIFLCASVSPPVTDNLNCATASTFNRVSNNTLLSLTSNSFAGFSCSMSLNSILPTQSFSEPSLSSPAQQPVTRDTAKSTGHLSIRDQSTSRKSRFVCLFSATP